MDLWRPAQIARLLFCAGGIALKNFPSMRWKLKSDNSLLTDTDIRIEKLFSKHFNHPEKGIFMIGEETIAEKEDEYISAALNGKCWIVDPIDGTAPFANNIPTWGISLGFSEKGRLSNGAIFLPFSGELYMTVENSAWMADNVSLDPMPKTLKMKKMRRPRANFAKGGMLSVSQDIVKRGSLNLKNPVQAVCCSVFSAAGLLRGRYSAYLGSSKLWDVAGAIPLLLSLGFHIALPDGRKIERQISDENCRLFDSRKNRRWRYKDSLIISPDKKTFDSLRKAFSIT
jgi:fructose-1,6-bisphosphatase/inositol monophosphatase family enzyme